MVGEFSGQGGSAEYAQDAEAFRAMILRIGESALRDFEKSLNEIQNEILEQGISPEEALVSSEDTKNQDQPEASAETPNVEVQAQINEAVANATDRYGNKISDESIQNLMRLAQTDPEAFKREIRNLNGEQAPATDEQDKAQQELARLLEGKSVEQFREDQQKLIDQLRGELTVERVAALASKKYLTQQDREDQERQMMSGRMAEIQNELAEAEQKLSQVESLLNDGAVFPPAEGPKPIAEEPVATGEQSAEGSGFDIEQLDPTSETYETEARVRRSKIEGAMQYMSDALKAKVLEELDKTEAAEKEILEAGQADFEGTPSDEEGGSPEDVAGAAAAAAGNSAPQRKIPRTDEQAKREYREGLSKWARETVPGRLDPEVAQIYDDEQRGVAEQKQKDKYASNLHAWAEAEKPGRFGDPESAPDNREGLINKLRGKLKGRKAFDNVLRRAIAGVGLSLVLASTVGSSVAQLGPNYNGNRMDKVYAVEDEGGWQDSAEADNAAQELAEDLGMSAEDLSGGEIDFSQYDLLAEGTAIYNEIAQRETSVTTPSGMVMDTAKYNDPARHGNSFAPSLEGLANDKEALINALIENNLDLPYQLAATVAAMPDLLQVCGLEQAAATQDVYQRSQMIMDAMLAEGGGDLQKKLGAGLKRALLNENAEVNIYQEYGLERTFYVDKFNPDNIQQPGDVKLKLDTKQRNGVWQAQIRIPVKGGGWHILDLNLPCGGQNNLEKNQNTIRLVFTDEDGTEYAFDLNYTPDTPDDDPDTPDAPDDPDVPDKPAEKNPDNQQRIVDNGGQTNPVTQTGNVDDLANDGIVDPSNQTPENTVNRDQTTGNLNPTYGQTNEGSATVGKNQGETINSEQQDDTTASVEEQAAAKAAQDNANNNEKAGSPTGKALDDYLDSLL